MKLVLDGIRQAERVERYRTVILLVVIGKENPLEGMICVVIVSLCGSVVLHWIIHDSDVVVTGFLGLRCCYGLPVMESAAVDFLSVLVLFQKVCLAPV